MARELGPIIGLLILAVLAVIHGRIPGLGSLRNITPSPREYFESMTPPGGSLILILVAFVTTFICRGLLYSAGAFVVKVFALGRLRCEAFRIDQARPLERMLAPRTLVTSNQCIGIGILFWVVYVWAWKELT